MRGVCAPWTGASRQRVDVAERDEGGGLGRRVQPAREGACDERSLKTTAPPRPPPKARRTVAPRRGRGASAGCAASRRRRASASWRPAPASGTSARRNSPTPPPPSSSSRAPIARSSRGGGTRRRLVLRRRLRGRRLEGAPVAGGRLPAGASRLLRRVAGRLRRRESMARERAVGIPRPSQGLGQAIDVVDLERDPKRARRVASTLGCRGGARDSTSARPSRRATRARRHRRTSDPR